MHSKGSQLVLQPKDVKKKLNDNKLINLKKIGCIENDSKK